MTQVLKVAFIVLWRFAVVFRRLFIGSVRRNRCAETDRIYRAFGAHEARQLGNTVGIYWASPIWFSSPLFFAYADGLINREGRFRRAGIPTLS